MELIKKVSKKVSLSQNKRLCNIWIEHNGEQKLDIKLEIETENDNTSWNEHNETTIEL